MSGEPVFVVKFWGVTGAYSTPLRTDEFSSRIRAAIRSLAQQGLLPKVQECQNDDTALAKLLEDHLPFDLHSTWGGNTMCIQVETPDSTIVIDTGSGFIGLGRELQQRWSAEGYTGKREANILLTHSHMDHTFGMPFADAGFDKKNKLIVWSSQQVIDGVNAVMDQSTGMSGVYFPQSFELLPALREFQPVEAPGEFEIGETQVQTHALNHPGGCTGFRLNCRGRSLVFAFDHEHQSAPDRELAAWASDADLLCIDGQYRKAEYEGRIGVMNGRQAPRKGWGHSPIESSVATGVAANAKQIALTHREPTRSDKDISAVEELAKEVLKSEIAKAKTSGAKPQSSRVWIPCEGETIHI